MKKIAIVSSNEYTITTFFKNHLDYLHSNYEITIFTKIINKDFLPKMKLKKINIPINRGYSLFSDLICLIYLIYSFLFNKYDLVFSCTPKGGILSILAGFVCRVPNRIHFFTGQVWITKKYFERFLLIHIDKLISYLSTDLLTDSISQKNILIKADITNIDKIRVLGNGSISGVDTNMFKPNKTLRIEVRKKLGISLKTNLILFLGRLNEDKGIIDLLDSFKILKKQKKDIALLIVGPDESNIDRYIRNNLSEYTDSIYLVGFTSSPHRFMAAADIFCLPSYREGFGMTAVEAAACELPVITSRIYGLTDAVEENVTGLMHEPGNIEQIVNSLIKILNQEVNAIKMAKLGRKRAIEKFNYSEITKLFVSYINDLFIPSKKSIVILASTSLSIESFLMDQIKKLNSNYNITIITNFYDKNKFLKTVDGKLDLIDLKIFRGIKLISDVINFIKLILLLRKKKYDLIFSVTPKGGFLGMFASFLVRIPLRIHWFGGQVWFNKKGFLRFLLKYSDILIGYFATNVLTECNSQLQFLESNNIIKKGRLKVLGNGSICGVDHKLFKPDIDTRKRIRKEMKISDEDLLLLYIGRLNLDKGVLDLAEAMSSLYSKYKNLYLLFVGPDEENLKDIISYKYRNKIDRIYFIDYTSSPYRFMAAADIFCLPSYREGFGMTAVEAAACELPVITSRIYGLTDAVEENVTGLMHKPNNIFELMYSIEKLINNPELSINLGKNGRRRSIKLFSKEKVVNSFITYIDKLLV